MSKIKVITAGIVAIAVVALKFLVPSAAQDLKELMVSDTDYRSVFTELGSRVADGGRELAAFLGLYEPEKPEEQTTVEPVVIRRPLRIKTIADTRNEVKALVHTVAEYIPAPMEAGQQPAEEEAAGAFAETETAARENPYEEAVAAFLESQTEYSGYEIPSNVSYSANVLPFEYTVPVTGRSSSGFGYRLHPISGGIKYHYGTDIAVDSGTDIYAFADGTVTAAYYDEGYGNYIIIEHADGYQTLYAHCSQLKVSAGESVCKGQLVALAGDTGQATGPHLHFELIYNDVYLNPEFYINSYGEL